MISRLVTGVALAVLLAGCAGDPSFTKVDETASNGFSKVAICYNGLNTTRAALEAMALQECPVGTARVQVYDHDTFWNICPISKKTRVTFDCLP